MGKDVSLQAEGMTGAACVGRVERVLAEQPGVAGASVTCPRKRYRSGSPPVR